MDLNIRLFLVLMLVLTTATVLRLEPYEVSMTSIKQVPQVVFYDFVSYTITPERIDSRLRGLEASKYHHRMLVDHPNLVRVVDKGLESVVAKKALFIEGKRVELKQDVRLERSDGWWMGTTQLFYDIPHRFYTTKGAPFLIRNGESRVRGKNLRYNQKSGKISADKIKATIVYEDR